MNVHCLYHVIGSSCFHSQVHLSSYTAQLLGTLTRTRWHIVSTDKGIATEGRLAIIKTKHILDVN